MSTTPHTTTAGTESVQALAAKADIELLWSVAMQRPESFGAGEQVFAARKELRDRFARLTTALAAEKREKEELLKDKARLDWIEANGAELQVEWDDGEAPLPWPEFRVKIRGMMPFRICKSHREAIDASRCMPVAPQSSAEGNQP